jgi:TolB protein
MRLAIVPHRATARATAPASPRATTLTAALAAATALAACGGNPAISSTTSGYKKADVAPPPPDTGAKAVTGTVPLPPADDPKERVVLVRGGSIWVMMGDGKDPARVTFRSSNAPDETPAISPGGTEVAFVSARDGVPKVFVAALDGTTTRPLTDGAEGGDAAPAWTPDGSAIVFVRGAPDRRRDLYAIPSGGGEPRLILEGRDDVPSLAGFPAISPDGATIAFSSDRGDGLGTGLWLVKIDGTGLRRLTRPPQAQSWIRDLRPAWSPDGKRIAFASNRHAASADDEKDLDIYEVEVASGTILRLTNDLAIADDPCYSPDGKRMFFTSTREATKSYAVELYAMPAGGGEQQRLTRDEVPQNAAPSAGRVP